MRVGRAFKPISAVITTCNDGAILSEALSSVAEQTVLPREILVIDDGSEPATAPAVIERFMAESGLDVKYVWQDNAGPSAARNLGLRQAGQEYVAYLDADDRWLPQHLEYKLARLQARDASYSTAYDAFVEFEGTSGRPLRTIPIRAYDGPIRADLLGMPNGIPAGMQFQLHRREALEAIGGFDEGLRSYEDFNLLLRFGKRGLRITGSATPTVWRRVHAASLTRRNPEWTLEETERYLAKAERDGLLTPAAVASKRKTARLRLGRQQILVRETALHGIDTLRDAFEFDRPKGLAQWTVFLAVRNRSIGRGVLGAYRILRSAGA
jgi:glycosyltransferase involved in cell wall biosynthesis